MIWKISKVLINFNKFYLILFIFSLKFYLFFLSNSIAYGASNSQVLITMLKAKESKTSLFGILFDIYHFSNVFNTISFRLFPV